MKKTYAISELQPYINWAYYYHSWQLRDPEQQRQSREEAELLLRQLNDTYHVYALFQLFNAHSDGDDIILSSSSMQRPCRCPSSANSMENASASLTSSIPGMTTSGFSLQR